MNGPFELDGRPYKECLGRFVNGKAIFDEFLSNFIQHKTERLSSQSDNHFLKGSDLFTRNYFV